MITNTCLIGGSFFAGEPAAGLGAAPSEASELPFELDGAVVGVVGLAAAGAAAGVGSDSAGGGSLLAVDDGSAEADADADAEAEAEVDGTAGSEEGSTTFSGERDEASDALGRVAATFPRSTPNPRNTSTSRAEILGAGSRRALAPIDPRAGPTAAGAGWAALTTAALSTAAGLCAVASAGRARPTTRPRSSSSRGLREPMRRPHERQ
jgi:hypothetical protein